MVFKHKKPESPLTQVEIEKSQKYEAITKHVVHDVPAIVQHAYVHRSLRHWSGTHRHLEALKIKSQLETVEFENGSGENFHVAKTLKLEIEFKEPMQCHDDFEEHIVALLIKHGLAPEISSYLENCANEN